MPRYHLYMVATNPAGDALENASVRILQPGTETPIAAPIYADDTTITAMTNPFTTTTGVISVYVDAAQRVRVGITPVGAIEQFVNDIDIGGAGSTGASTHVGAGSGSTTVGLNSSSAGVDSVALGQDATAGGNGSTALGHLADATGLNSTVVGSSVVGSAEKTTAVGRAAAASALSATAIGALSGASGVQTTAMGDSAVANSLKATALGASATAGQDHSTALGADAVVTEPNQVMLGTGSDFAEAPGGYLLTSANGIRYNLIVLPDGALSTINHVPTGATNLLSTDESGFEAGIGSWAAVSGLTSATQSADYAYAGTNSLKLVLSGAAAASAISSKVAAVAATVYVGRARMFYHAGAATAGLNGTLWLEFYDGANALIGSASAGRSRAFYADAWIRFDVRAVAPTGTATVAIRAGLPTGGGAAADAFYLDAVSIQAVPGSI